MLILAKLWSSLSLKACLDNADEQGQVLEYGIVKDNSVTVFP